MATNPKTPISALIKLSEDPEGEVRAGVAQNRNTPASILEKLSKDEYKLVRYHAINNSTYINKDK